MSFCYVLLRWLLEFVAMRVGSKEFMELEIVVLRHELAILRRKTRRPAITAVDRLFLSAASRLLRASPMASLHRYADDAAAMSIGAWSRSGGRSRIPSVVRYLSNQWALRGVEDGRLAIDNNRAEN